MTLWSWTWTATMTTTSSRTYVLEILKHDILRIELEDDDETIESDECVDAAETPLATFDAARFVCDSLFIALFALTNCVTQALPRVFVAQF